MPFLNHPNAFISVIMVCNVVAWVASVVDIELIDVERVDNVVTIEVSEVRMTTSLAIISSVLSNKST